MRRIVAAGAAVCGLVLCWPWGVKAAVAVPRVCAGCNFANLQLEGSDFSRVIYIGSNFLSAGLRAASFRGAKLIAANFANADLRGAAFDAADCTACNFSGAKFDGVTFTGARMTAANFAGFKASIENAQLRELLAGCIACNFSASRLAGRDLSGLALISVDFSKADLRGTKFDGAVLCWNNIEGTHREVKCDTMREAQVTGASFLNIQLCDDPLERRACAPVDADALRRYTGSELSGATFR